MALSFFHGGQLAKGIQVHEGEGEGSQHAQSLRRLYSETALKERFQSENGSFTSRTASRPRTSHFSDTPRATSRPRTGPRTESARARFQEHILPDSEPRATSLQQAQSSLSVVQSAEPPKTQPRTFLGIQKPSFLSLRAPARKSPDTERPKSSGPDKRSWKQKEALRREAMRTKKAEQPSAVKAAQPSTSHQPARAATPQAPPRDSQPSRLGDPRRVDTPVAAQAAPNPALFLAESLAHVIVGEWLFKDPHKPGLFPQSNILQRHIGPPPRGATGVPQRRWFRIDPYERLLSWSSKWDTVETAQHKMSRKVPIKLVFEVPNRIPLDGCIPTHAAPYDYSIVVVAPSKVLKITAPDDTRHNMWLTALQYLVDATKKVNNDTWPDVLATRLALLTQPVEDLFATDKPLPTPRSRQEDHPDARASVATDKPLPPSPPRIATASTAMKPPSVPRFVQHGREQSAGLSTTAETEAFGRTSESSKGVAASVRSQQAEPFTPYDEKPVSEPRESMQQETGHDTDTETDVGQMDAILDRLPGM